MIKSLDILTSEEGLLNQFLLDFKKCATEGNINITHKKWLTWCCTILKQKKNEAPKISKRRTQPPGQSKSTVSREKKQKMINDMNNSVVVNENILQDSCTSGFSVVSQTGSTVTNNVLNVMETTYNKMMNNFETREDAHMVEKISESLEPISKKLDALMDALKSIHNNQQRFPLLGMSPSYGPHPYITSNAAMPAAPITTKHTSRGRFKSNASPVVYPQLTYYPPAEEWEKNSDEEM